MTLQVAEQALLESDLTMEINLFVGAGFSTLARNRFGKTLPVGNQLKNDIIGDFHVDHLASLDLPSLYTIISAERRDELRSYLVEKFSVHEYDPSYDALHKLKVSHLYTTNIDDLPYQIFRPNDKTGRVLHDVYQFGAPRKSTEVVQYIALHGNIRHDDSDFLFTGGQISSAFASDRETWYVFQREIQVRPTLFLGYGMNDAGVLQALHDSGGVSSNRWILLRKNDVAATQLYQSLGFHIMVGEIADFLHFVRDLPSASIAATSSKRLTGQVPRLGEFAQRPVKNFFLGAEPEWSDAYSKQVVRQRINSKIKNSVLSGRHVAIVGVPLSGKTTILKQVAVDFADNRDVLYFDRITEPVLKVV